MTRTSRGFTMLELMVALGVFAIALLATLASIASSDQLRMTSRESELAAEILNDRLEGYQALGKAAVQNWQGVLVNRCNADMNGTDPRLPGSVITVAVLDEVDTANTFVIDKDGTAGADPLDLDDDGNMNESGVFSGSTPPATIHASWNQGKTAPFNSDVSAYSIVPIRVTVTWTTTTGGGGQARSLSAVTLVYPKG